MKRYQTFTNFVLRQKCRAENRFLLRQSEFFYISKTSLPQTQNNQGTKAEAYANLIANRTTYVKEFRKIPKKINNVKRLNRYISRTAKRENTRVDCVE